MDAVDAPRRVWSRRGAERSAARNGRARRAVLDVLEQRDMVKPILRLATSTHALHVTKLAAREARDVVAVVRKLIWNDRILKGTAILEGHQMRHNLRVLARRQAPRDDEHRQDSAALGRRDGRAAGDARGAHRLRPQLRVLTRRQARRDGEPRHNGAALEPRALR
ncbi:hypothetical protein M885DRAFT_522374 [Pelagophyceae sp. CCMP2097]|nr:hypothetical protein M885DRAFT_522374 [Pelagophyceae sp. CCMP2097]